MATIKSANVVDSRLVFPLSRVREALDAFLSLPGNLHPTHHRVGENERRMPIGNSRAFREYKTEKSGGFFLHARRATYDVQPLAGLPVECNGFNIPTSLAWDFLLHMAKAGPDFGYCCADEEERHRNYHETSISSGYRGRDIEKYVPGLYWLTLISERLLEKHHVPLVALKKIALKHITPATGVHLFRFYERPEDWQSSTSIEQLYKSAPGIFDLDKVRPLIRTDVTFAEYMKQLREWD
jgi:hypothetical protein